MNDVYKIKYIDASYIDSSYKKNKRLGKTRLHYYEAYGYLHKNGSDIVLIFIKENKKKQLEKTTEIIKGLVIPDTAIVSVTKKNNNTILGVIKKGSCVEVWWRDIVIVTNQPVYESSVMYTEGVLFRIEKDHIIIKNPETIRTYPLPVRNHPPEKPLYYIIPLLLITNILTIDEYKK